MEFTVTYRFHTIHRETQKLRDSTQQAATQSKQCQLTAVGDETFSNFNCKAVKELVLKIQQSTVIHNKHSCCCGTKCQIFTNTF